MIMERFLALIVHSTLLFGPVRLHFAASSTHPDPSDPLVQGRTLLLRFTPADEASMDPVMVLEYDALLQHNDAAVEAMCINNFCDLDMIRRAREPPNSTNTISDVDNAGVDASKLQDARMTIFRLGVQQTVESYHVFDYGSIEAYLDDASRADQDAMMHRIRRIIDDPKAFLAEFGATMEESSLSLSPQSSSSSGAGVEEEDRLIRALQKYSTMLFQESRYEEVRAISIIILTQFLQVHADVFTLTLVALGEVSRILGYQRTAASAIASLIAIQSGFNTRAALLCRFRLLGYTSVLPERFSQSAVSRARVMRDLQAFARYVDEGEVQTTLDDCLAEQISLPFYLSHQGLNDRILQERFASLYVKLCPGIQFVAPHLVPPSSELGAGNRQKRIQLGFVSSLFYDHSIGRIMSEVMLYLHLKHSDLLDLHVIQIRPHGASSAVKNEDPIQAALLQHLGRRFYIIAKGVKEIRSDIASMELDVLVFPDIGMDSLSYVLAFSRLATYQIVWWGHPITTGIPSDSIDYFFSLDVEVDGPADHPGTFEAEAVRMDSGNDLRFSRIDSQTIDYRRHMTGFPNASHSAAGGALRRGDGAASHYTEQMVRMEFINSVYIDAESIPQYYPSAEREALLKILHIPTGSPYCLVPGRLFKIHPNFDRVVKRILSLNKGAFVVFIHEKAMTGLSYLMASRLRDLLSDDEMQRVRFGSMKYFPFLSKFATIALDTFPYGGCLTVHEMLASGVPVVTMPSHFVRGRYALAMYQQMGVGGLVAESEEHYVALASQLLSNSSHREATAALVYRAFRRRLHRNNDVAREWRRFIERLFV